MALVVDRDGAEVGVGIADTDRGWITALDVGSNVARSRWTALVIG